MNRAASPVRWLVLLSAAIAVIAAVLAAVLPVTMTSATGSPAARNGVEASHPQMTFTVGSSRKVRPVQGRCDSVPQARFAAGLCVAAEDATEPTVGQTVYRVYGGDSKAEGASWSPVDPNSVPDFRDVAGLPSGGASAFTNTGRFVIEGRLVDPSAVVQRSAIALDGNDGGLPEYIIPNWLNTGKVMILRVSGVNPEF